MNIYRLAGLSLLPLVIAACQSTPLHVQTASPWVADLGDGRYQNPVLHADYSDPDAVRVGDTYYMTASSFNAAPGLPLLRSKDLVNWELAGHALPALAPAARYATARHGEGVWAPSLRYHEGKFWIFYPDPDLGIFVTTATHFSGPWSVPRLLLPGKGIIDPTPRWDDDGNAYLLHAWAKSRAGFNNVLTLRRMVPDASSLLDGEGVTLIDGNRIPGYRTLEGPKFYKANGFYYVFAPAGGVEHGWQAVFRARSIEGPYEVRTVMDQGNTPINGPHQGAWVRALDGADWFLHFQDKGAHGRVVHLQPMRWEDGWPLIGEPGPRAGTGQPVLVHAKPVVGMPLRVPATIDEFGVSSLGLQWQWNANPQPHWHSLDERRGYLRLRTQGLAAGAPLRTAPSILAQKLPAPGFVVDTHVELVDAREGDRAGLILNGLHYAWLGLRRRAGATELVYTTCTRPAAACVEQAQVVLARVPAALWLRMSMEEGARARFSFSTDNVRFTPVGQPFVASKGRWVGAQIGLFSVGTNQGSAASNLDVDYFRVGPAAAHAGK